MNKPLISISVPVYNAEKYLRQCLDSLVNQTLHNIEIVIVNDGSIDSSEAICREYAEKDSRIVLICKENGGSASARLAALQASKGKYFCACDADDWVEPDMYEKLYEKAIVTDADVVMCDYYSEYGNGQSKMSIYGKKIPSRIEQIIDDALNGKFPCSVWSKLFNREIFEKYHLSWEKGINMGEDFLMTLKILKHPVKIEYFAEPLYHYRRMPGENSYTNNVTLASYNQMLYIQNWIESNLNRLQYVRGINHYLINIAFAGLRVSDGMTANYYKQTSTRRLGFLDLLRERSLKSLVVLWTKLFGYHAGLLIYKLLYKRVYK